MQRGRPISCQSIADVAKASDDRYPPCPVETLAALKQKLRGLRRVTGTTGRHSYLYAGGERADMIYSLFGTTKFKGVDPEAWLHHVRTRSVD